jgi:hypothetical protein
LNEQFAKEDADPTKPHKYRITIGDKTQERELTDEQVAAAQKRDQNLKASKIPRTATPGMVADWVTERMKPTPGQREDAKPNPGEKEDAKEKAKREEEERKAKLPLKPAEANQMMSPILAEVISDHPEWSRFTMRRPVPGGESVALKPYGGGEGSILPWKDSEKDIKKNYKDFQKAVGDEMIRQNQGHRIKEILPGYFGDEGATAPEYTPEPMEAPPAS